MHASSLFHSTLPEVEQLTDLEVLVDPMVQSNPRSFTAASHLFAFGLSSNMYGRHFIAAKQLVSTLYSFFSMLLQVVSRPNGCAQEKVDPQSTFTKLPTQGT